MTGQDFYNRVQTILHNFGMDQDMFYMFLNSARIERENARAWMRLRKLDTSNSANTSNTFQTPYDIPDDFQFLSKDGKILLWDQDQTYEEMNEIPYEYIIQYKDQNLNFAMDHASGIFYITGILDRTYQVRISYQADWGDIAAASTWINIPSRFHPILVYDVVAMYELGVDYDDINARNANAHIQAANRLFNSMVEWDNNLQRSAVTTMDYPILGDQYQTFRPNQIDINS